MIVCSIFSIAALLSSCVTTLWAMVLTYVVIYGIGMGIAYSPPIAASVRLLPQHKGLVTGIIVAGFGGGAGGFDVASAAFQGVDTNHDGGIDRAEFSRFFQQGL